MYNKNSTHATGFFKSDRDMFKQMTDAKWRLQRKKTDKYKFDDRQVPIFEWYLSRATYEYAIALEINLKDIRVFLGVQEPKNADPTPEMCFKSYSEMAEWMIKQGWVLKTTVKYPYDGWTRYIFEFSPDSATMEIEI